MMARWGDTEIMSGGWQPIETAPRDGTAICMYIPERSDQFQCGFWIWETDENDDPKIGVWWSGDGRNDAQPTHWMPLPLPPEAK